MGMENDVMLSFLGDNERFADVFNFGFFHGEKVVQAGDLMEKSETYRPSIWEIYDDAKQQTRQTGTRRSPKTTTRTRDLIKTLHTGQSLKLVAIESQSDINYLMPWRIMNYDNREYEKQTKQIAQTHKHDEQTGLQVYRTDAERLSRFRSDDRLNPVYTLCVYHGTKPWDGPRSLKDLMDFGTTNPQMWEEAFADYPVRILCLNELKDFSGLCSSVRELFRLLPHRKSKKELLDFVNSHPEYHNLDAETADAISCITNLPNLIEQKESYKTEGGYDMCQAIKELIEDSKAEGRNEEHSLMLALTSKLYKFMLANPDANNDAIATACECDINDVIEIRTAWEK